MQTKKRLILSTSDNSPIKKSIKRPASYFDGCIVIDDDDDDDIQEIKQQR